MSAPRCIVAVLVAPLLLAPAAAQQPKPKPAWPERDLLSPFRKCDEIAAPPDKVFAQLRIMRAIADAPDARKDFDKDGREIVDDERWRAARTELARLFLDPGHLAQIVRGSRNADDRALAFYGAFYCHNVDHVFNLIGHIPGEPEAKTRALAYPRAVAFLRAHLGQRWKDLTAEDQQAVLKNLPEPGSPAALERGIKRAPRDEDALHEINLRPFLQLLDLDTPTDQAQALWFLKETCLVRRDLAQLWLEPSLPRVQQLLGSDAAPVRKEAEGLLLAIGGKDLAPLPPDADAAARQRFADAAIRPLFPPIRVVSEGLLLLQPCAERLAIVAAGREALASGGLGDPAGGRTSDDQPYRGFRIARVPAALEALRIPVGAVITAVNGAPVDNGPQLLAVIENQFRTKDGKGGFRDVSSARLVVEYVLDGKARAIEYRVE